MGGLASSNKKKNKDQIKANNTIGKELRCETCLKVFPPHTKINFYGNHIKTCYKINRERERIENLLNDLRESNFEMEQLEKNKIKKHVSVSNNLININDNNFSVKIKKNSTMKKPNIERKEFNIPENYIDPSDIYFMSPEIFLEKNRIREVKNHQKKFENNFRSTNYNLSNSNPLGLGNFHNDNYNSNNNLNVNLDELSFEDFENLRSFPFEEKLKFFRGYIKNIKIDWREGSCNLEIDRDDFFRQSMMQFEKIDPYKELKINFRGEISHDAGGLIREWYSIIFKYLQSENISKED